MVFTCDTICLCLCKSVMRVTLDLPARDAARFLLCYTRYIGYTIKWFKLKHLKVEGLNWKFFCLNLKVFKVGESSWNVREAEVWSYQVVYDGGSKLSITKSGRVNVSVTKSLGMKIKKKHMVTNHVFLMTIFLITIWFTHKSLTHTIILISPWGGNTP